MVINTCIYKLLRLITALISKSLWTGTFPEYVKVAIICPLLKIKQS